MAEQSGENSGVLADAGGILAERDIARVMRFVLDMPVLADGGGGQLGVDRLIGQIERGLGRAFPQARRGLERVDHALDLNDGDDETGPFRFRDGGIGVENPDGSGLVAIASLFVDCLDDGEGLGRAARAFDFFAQRGLVVFDLDDQMRFRGGCGLEGFFWQCMASQVTMWPATSSSSSSF